MRTRRPRSDRPLRAFPRRLHFAWLSRRRSQQKFKAMIAPTADLVGGDGALVRVCPPRTTRAACARRSSRRIRYHRADPAHHRRAAAQGNGRGARRRVICAELAKLGGRSQARVHEGVPATVFAAQDKIPRRSCKDEGPTPNFARLLPEGARVIFFSSAGSHVSHPDDDKGTKRAAIVDAARPTRSRRASSWNGVYMV